MQQRFITNALFHSRNGLLRSSLKGVDRVILLKAVRSGLRNENGRTRGTFGSVSANLTFENNLLDSDGNTTALNWSV